MKKFNKLRALSSMGFATALLYLGTSFAQSEDSTDTSTDVHDTSTAQPNETAEGDSRKPPSESGEETKNSGVPSAVIHVLKTDGAPAGKVSVFAGIFMGQTQSPMKTVSAVTDEEGDARFDGLPASPSIKVSFWFELGGVAVARTRPMPLPPRKPLRMEMRLPRMTSDPREVVIEHARVVLSRSGALFEIIEVFHLTCPGDCVYFAQKTGYPISLPKGAVAARPMDDEDTSVRVDGNRLVVLQPISKSPAVGSFVFDLPIRDEKVTLRQPLPSKVQSAQVISTWVDDKRSELKGVGFSEARITETNRGLAAWSIVARNLDAAAIEITLSGIEDGPAGLRRNVTLVLAVFLLALGIAAWIRAMRRKPKEETEDA